jgi:chromosome partitioning protein
LKALKHLEGYDYIVVDCPPNLGIFTVNSIIACGNVLVPIQAEYYPLEGVGHLIKLANAISERLDIPVRLRYIITMMDSRTKLGKEVEKEVRKELGDKVFKTVIPRNVKLAEAPSHGKPIALYDPECKGAKAYKKLAGEVMALEEW